MTNEPVYFAVTTCWAGHAASGFSNASDKSFSPPQWHQPTPLRGRSLGALKARAGWSPCCSCEHISQMGIRIAVYILCWGAPCARSLPRPECQAQHGPVPLATLRSECRSGDPFPRGQDDIWEFLLYLDTKVMFSTTTIPQEIHFICKINTK